MTTADEAATEGRMTTADGEGAEDPRAYLAEVMAEIDHEVRRRRASGDLPVRVERELDELFLEFSPVVGRGGDLSGALRMVDAATFIDPVVPIASAKSGGAAVKRGLRSLSLWYVGFVTHQVSQFATAVSRSLHLVDEQLRELRAELDAQRTPAAPVVDVEWAHTPDAWWVAPAGDALAQAAGRVLHAACGDGWLVRRLRAGGVDAYGVDPRPDVVERALADTGGTEADLRSEDVLDHLRATGSGTLGGLVLSGVVETLAAGQRAQLLDAAADRLAPGGVLVVHSLSRAAWSADDAPLEADLAPGGPLRPPTWTALLRAAGFEPSVLERPSRRGPGDHDPAGADTAQGAGLGPADYAVVAVLGDGLAAHR